MPKRIQRKRIKGWRMPKNAIYVGRPSKFGNPFSIKVYGFKPEEALRLYKKWIEGKLWRRELTVF